MAKTANTQGENSSSTNTGNNAGNNTRSNTGSGNAGASAAQTAKQTNAAPAAITPVEEPKPAAATLVEQVKSTATGAYQSAAAKATETIEEQKTNLTGGLTNIADNVRKFGESLTSSGEPDGLSKFAAEYTGSAAEKLEQAAHYFEDTDLKVMYRDVENAARRYPAMILGGAFALGFLATRFLKSAPPKPFSEEVGEETKSNRRAANA